MGKKNEKYEKLYIVFDGPPGPEGGRFVEVENEHGVSVRAGEWVEVLRGGNRKYWTLQLGGQPVETAKLQGKIVELKALLRRIVKYATEDRAVTPGFTRLDRVLEEALRASAED